MAKPSALPLRTHFSAGITSSHYHELCLKSTPFVCMVCTQHSQRTIFQQLQDKVTALRSEFDQLREAAPWRPWPPSKLTKQRWTLSRMMCNI